MEERSLLLQSLIDCDSAIDRLKFDLSELDVRLVNVFEEFAYEGRPPTKGEVERLWDSVGRVCRRSMRINDLMTAISASANYEREKHDNA
jgi:hypothetical protein